MMAINCQKFRIKVFLFLLISIFLTSLLYCYIGDQQPLNGIYENNLSQSIARIKKVVVPAVEENRKYYLRSNRHNRQSQDFGEKYMHLLGFTGNPRLFPQHVWTNVSLPVFVTAIKSSDIEMLKELISSLQDFYPDASLIVYELNLDEEESKTVKNFCNSSVSCSLRKFEFKSFPSHVRDLKLYAFRPIIMQEVLHQAGAVLWLNANYQITPKATSKVAKVIDGAKKEGIKCWTINEPTTAMTHPRMFDYFNTSQEKYYFHRMIEPSSFIIYNVEKIHKQVMLPWVRCALSSECISPIGAQSSGCRYDKKPLYRYSGCHHYDMSALNILLGSIYNYKAELYSASAEDKFFRPISQEIIDARIEPNQYSQGIKGISTIGSAVRASH